MVRFISYVKIARPDHWVKNIFVLPGMVFAAGLVGTMQYSRYQLLCNFIVGMISVCLIASANYTINEWLDAAFDQYHPVKKYRPAVSHGVKAWGVYLQYIILLVIGISLGFLVSPEFASAGILLAAMGVIYNVKPLRSKDKPFLDVLSESINNPIRLFMGWFIVTNLYLPPVSLVVGYWFGGAFLMAMKRYSEYRMILASHIGNQSPKTTAALYRKSFAFYNEEILLNYSFFFALCTVFLVGIFLLKYKIEMLFFVPFLAGLFCWYFHVSLKADSAAQKPEKLYRERNMMLYLVFLIILFCVCMFIDVPALHSLIDPMLIPLSW